MKNSNKFGSTTKSFETFLKKVIVYQNFNSKNLDVNEEVFVISVGSGLIFLFYDCSFGVDIKKNSNKFELTIKSLEAFLKKAIIYQNFNSKNLN